jgi:hypothetical protein
VSSTLEYFHAHTFITVIMTNLDISLHFLYKFHVHVRQDDAELRFPFWEILRKILNYNTRLSYQSLDALMCHIR